MYGSCESDSAAGSGTRSTGSAPSHAREGAVLEVGLEAPTSAERPPPAAPARAPASVWLANFMKRETHISINSD